MKVNINRDACIGCGLCVSICPDIFEINEENIADVKSKEMPDAV
ncbi:ferredoxin [bacterium]|nr:ferredoxin [bacterium]